MTEDQQPISVVTDISANIFAVFIVILIVLLALPHDEPRPPPPPKPVDVTRDLVAVARAPLSGGAMVDLLFARRRASTDLSIDLFNDRIVVARPGRAPEELALPLRDRDSNAIAGMVSTTSAPIGLYVFDHRGYAAIIRLLGVRPFREISVPAALRAIVEQRQDWREGFRALIDGATDIDGFRTDLSRLLASPDPSLANAPVSVSATSRMGEPTAAIDAPSDGLFSHLQIWLQRAIATVAIAFGLGLIALVEWHGGRRWRRIVRAGRR